MIKDPAQAHVYGHGRYRRLLIAEEVTTWAARLEAGHEYPGRNCVFLSNNQGTTWQELYLLSVIGKRSETFHALVLGTGGTPHMICGSADDVQFMRQSYQLVTDEPLNLNKAVYLTRKELVRVGESDDYEVLRRCEQ